MFIGLGDVSGSLQIFQDVFFPESFSGSGFFQGKKQQSPSMKRSAGRAISHCRQTSI